MFLGVDLVEEEVNQDSGDGDVHPDWPSPAGDSAVFVESFAEGVVEGQEHQWHHRHGEDGVGEKDGQVNGSEPGWVLEAGGAGVVMVSKVADQKEARGQKGRDHAVAVRDFVTFFNEDQAQYQKYGGETVEHRVDDGQITDMHDN